MTSVLGTCTYLKTFSPIDFNHWMLRYRYKRITIDKQEEFRAFVVLKCTRWYWRSGSQLSHTPNNYQHHFPFSDYTRTFYTSYDKRFPEADPASDQCKRSNRDRLVVYVNLIWVVWETVPLIQGKNDPGRSITFYRVSAILSNLHM